MPNQTPPPLPGIVSTAYLQSPLAPFNSPTLWKFVRIPPLLPTLANYRRDTLVPEGIYPIWLHSVFIPLRFATTGGYPLPNERIPNSTPAISRNKGLSSERAEIARLGWVRG